jgi:Putative peptidoglycan binding domain
MTPRQGSSARGPSFEHSLSQELRFAAYSGLLKMERVDRVRVVPPPTEREAEALGPESSQDAAPDAKSWVGLTLADQNGTPLPNRAYRVIRPDGTTVDGTLDSNGSAILNGLDAGNCQIWCPYVAPRPATTYAVADGDHISGIAQSFGYDDYTVVWNDPGNADLQSQRGDPHVLQAGDVLTIPEVTAQAAANKPTSAKHPFTLDVSPLKLRLVMLDLAANPIVGEPVTVTGTALTTDGSGRVEATVDKGARDVTLDAPDVAGTLQIGLLNPADDASDAGYKARLFNLGFLWDASADDTDDEMVVAVQDFQEQYAIDVSGQLDDATKAQLLQIYGA